MSRVVIIALAGALIGACSSFGTNADPAPTPTGAPDAGTDAAVRPPDAGADADASAACGDDDIACEVSCAGALCQSCREIAAAAPASASGFYLVRSKGGANVPVYCDLATAGGGWTLAARSLDMDTVDVGKNFGWHRSFGDVMDRTQPYSLDVMSTLVAPPTEMLFGLRDDAFGWGAQVYRVALPTDFFTAGASKAFAIKPTTVKGACAGGSFQRYAGYVEMADHFQFRDNDRSDGSFGLFPDGWYLNGSDSCDSGGDLEPAEGSKAGMIFVR